MSIELTFRPTDIDPAKAEVDNAVIAIAATKMFLSLVIIFLYLLFIVIFIKLTSSFNMN
jgi:hypothetical protein